MSKRIHIVVEDEFLDALDALAAAMGASRSSTVRRALKDGAERLRYQYSSGVSGKPCPDCGVVLEFAWLSNGSPRDFQYCWKCGTHVTATKPPNLSESRGGEP